MNKRFIAPVLGVSIVAAGLTAAPAAQALVAPLPRASAATTAPAVTAARTVRLFIDNEAVVGTTISGFIQVSDILGPDQTPAAGVAVAMQEKRGTSYVTVADGVTDASGRLAVGSTVDTNTTLRAVYTQSTGRVVAGPAVAVAAVARVTWASRPDLEMVKGAGYTYAFRITPAVVSSGHFEIASSRSPKVWAKAKSVARSNYGIVSQRVVFPKAGTWLLRGATDATRTNGAGYTSTLVITVS